MRFDLIDLQLFLHVVEAGSITGGATRAHLSLASCSERIHGMEETLGVPLLLRGRRGVTPTPAGEALVRHARLVFQQLQRMRAELGDHAEGLEGHGAAAVQYGLAERIPAGGADRLPGAPPHVDINLEERPSHEVAKAVREGAADLGILADAVDLSQLESFPFRLDRLVAVATPELAHLLSPDGRPVDFVRLADFDQVGLAGDSALSNYLELQARRLGRTLHARVRLRGFEAVCRMVEAGVGIGIVPEPAARRCAQTMKIAVLELADAWALRQLAICVKQFR
jgi:DNA-binding transcriptional LysR family regulator